ncbi:unnamed protein product [Amoebophrya sp. A120]|nr:unnamed protein product [Amoebophrya sp. A120]|eukprot:GSA120T00006965001.1
MVALLSSSRRTAGSLYSNRSVRTSRSTSRSRLGTKNASPISEFSSITKIAIPDDPPRVSLTSWLLNDPDIISPRFQRNRSEERRVSDDEGESVLSDSDFFRRASPGRDVDGQGRHQDHHQIRITTSTSDGHGGSSSATGMRPRSKSFFANIGLNFPARVTWPGSTSTSSLRKSHDQHPTSSTTAVFFDEAQIKHAEGVVKDESSCSGLLKQRNSFTNFAARATEIANSVLSGGGGGMLSKSKSTSTTNTAGSAAFAFGTTTSRTTTTGTTGTTTITRHGRTPSPTDSAVSNQRYLLQEKLLAEQKANVFANRKANSFTSSSSLNRVSTSTVSSWPRGSPFGTDRSSRGRSSSNNRRTTSTRVLNSSPEDDQDEDNYGIPRMSTTNDADCTFYKPPRPKQFLSKSTFGRDIHAKMRQPSISPSPSPSPDSRVDTRVIQTGINIGEDVERQIIASPMSTAGPRGPSSLSKNLLLLQQPRSSSSSSFFKQMWHNLKKKGGSSTSSTTLISSYKDHEDDEINDPIRAFQDLEAGLLYEQGRVEDEAGICNGNIESSPLDSDYDHYNAARISASEENYSNALYNSPGYVHVVGAGDELQQNYSSCRSSENQVENRNSTNSKPSSAGTSSFTTSRLNHRLFDEQEILDVDRRSDKSHGTRTSSSSSSTSSSHDDSTYAGREQQQAGTKQNEDDLNAAFELQVSSSVPNSVASNNCTPQNGGTTGAGTTAAGFGGGRVYVMGAEQRPPELQYRAG